MQRLVLVNPPVGRYDTAEIAPPLSLLSLAVSAASVGRDVTILDLNLQSHRPYADHEGRFFEHAIQLIANEHPAAVGITSMGVNTHIAMRLAARVTAEIGCPVAIGGVHAKSVAPVLQQFVAPGTTIDGSDEHRIGAPSLSPEQVPGAMSSHVSVAQYFLSNSRRVANLESGRGCRYKCAFCYSPDTYGRWHTYSVDGVAATFEALDAQGFKHVFLVDDNLTNSTEWFMQLCRSLRVARHHLTWNGYATLPDLTPELMTEAAAAGCTNLYLGVDVVHPEQQRAWHKSFYRQPEKLRQLLRHAAGEGMSLTCAYILDLKPESDHFSYATLEAAIQAADDGADSRLSVVTPYPRTQIGASASAHAYEYDCSRARILFDLPVIAVENEYAVRNVLAFPWHARPAVHSAEDWAKRLLAVHAAQVLLRDIHLLPSRLKDGASFWRHCMQVAIEAQTYERVHKTELKDLVRRVHSALAA